MTAEDLRKSILQQAIQGKLVPQDPNDEPASELLSKIRAEKERLIKEKKIKRDKNETIIYRGEDNSYYEKFADGKVVCIDDEIPFEIPSGWEWCRLGSLVDFSKSKSVKANNIAPDAWLLDLEDIEKDSGKLLHKKRKGTTTSISDKHRFERGNVLYSKLRPYLNKVIIADEDGYCTSEILCFDFGMIYNKYAQLFLMSPFFVEYAMSDAYGVKMPRLGSKQGNNGLIPIPPREEQTRIVNFINSLEPYIEIYSNAQASLDIINKEVKNTLKKSILQEAIQGKLVTQDNSEKSASILLQRIKEEKLRLVKEGKLKKKDVIDSTIFRGDDNKYYEKVGKSIADITDSIPFEIPDSWLWCRLSSVADLYTGNSINETEKKNKYTNVEGVKYIATKDVQFDHSIIYNNGIAIPKQYVSEFKIAPANSVLMCIEGGSAGRKIGILSHDVCFGNKLCCFKPYADISEYIYYYLQSPLFYSIFLSNKNGIIGGVSVNNLKQLLIPIPPLSEIKRIVNKLRKSISIIGS